MGAADIGEGVGTAINTAGAGALVFSEGALVTDQASRIPAGRYGVAVCTVTCGFGRICIGCGSAGSPEGSRGGVHGATGVKRGGVHGATGVKLVGGW